MQHEPETKAIFTDVLERMLKAGWLHSFRYTDGKGFHLVMTPKGTTQTAHWNMLIEGFGLQDDDRTMLALDKFSRGQRLPEGCAFQSHEGEPPFPEEILQFIRDSIQELGLADEGDKLIAFAAIVDGWGYKLSDEDKARLSGGS